jgi:hypothetical protein
LIRGSMAAPLVPTTAAIPAPWCEHIHSRRLDYHPHVPSLSPIRRGTLPRLRPARGPPASVTPPIQGIYFQ